MPSPTVIAAELHPADSRPGATGEQIDLSDIDDIHAVASRPHPQGDDEAQLIAEHAIPLAVAALVTGGLVAVSDLPADTVKSLRTLARQLGHLGCPP